MFRLLGVILISVLFSSVKADVLNTPEGKVKLDEALSTIQTEHNIPMLSVAVIDDGEFVYGGDFGVGLSGSNKSISTKPRFRIASITKLFTAQSIMQLNEIGVVQLDDLVSRYIDQFNDQQTTIEDLLTHRSGLRDTVKPVALDKGRSFSDYLSQSLVNNSPSTESDFNYADLNYNILGQVIREALSVNYTDYVRASIIERLGLKNTYFRQSNIDFIEPELPHHNYGVIHKASARPYDTSFAPSEGLISTAADLAIWASAVLKEHPALLSRESYRDMVTPRGKTNWGELQIALGWQVLGHEIMQLAQHAGSMNGYKSLLITYPLRKRAIVVLANAEEVPRWDIANVVNQVLEKQNLTLPESSQRRYQIVLGVVGLILLGVIGFFVRRRLVA